MIKQRFCIKCGKIIPTDSVFCPYCGTKQPEVSSNQKIIKPTATNKRAEKRNSNAQSNKLKTPLHKRIIFTILLFIVALATIGGGGYVLHQRQEAADQQALQAKNDDFNIYDSKFKNTAKSLTKELVILDSQTKRVWYDAIYAAPVIINGKSYATYRQAINAHFDQWRANGKMNKINANKTSLKNNFKQLSSNVTSSNQKQYTNDTKLNDDLQNYWKIVTSPSGTYKHYSAESKKAKNKLNSDLTK
ncbi:hypothetical protein IWT25_00439 [Secundilactobacillus pentosiphilus]|uniref:Zinc-ribbon domain-containing protein n=1 Tax=Secundilactobacillus pentosiphilus TaxID=1714682 RepID=A0A1Z5ITY1_9LACO|nr:zinc ribbon domain-containing protein [Secundilactobacillus pentosiphilus]GAX05136.1 hypothetical protein IWT25_00439 [Secundilactobacillus pentosiphilus]